VYTYLRYCCNTSNNGLYTARSPYDLLYLEKSEANFVVNIGLYCTYYSYNNDNNTYFVRRWLTVLCRSPFPERTTPPQQLWSPVNTCTYLPTCIHIYKSVRVLYRYRGIIIIIIFSRCCLRGRFLSRRTGLLRITTACLYIILL